MVPIVVSTPPPTFTPVPNVAHAVIASSDWGTYVVQRGDNLSVIAHRHRTTVSALVARNSLPHGGRLIHPGQRLQVPTGAGAAAAPTPAAAPAPAATTSSYTVRAGDTLIAIARRHGTSARAIAGLNSMNVGDIIRVGQTLRVPTNGTTAAKAASTTPTPAPSPSPAPSTQPATTYTVRAGDTLSGIAARHGTTARRIAEANSVSVNAIIGIGQRLTIPGTAPAASPAPAPAAPAPAAPKATTSSYTVRAGDTLIGIANRHGTSARAIAGLNSMNVNDIIRVGQRLKVPTDGTAAAKAASTTPAPAPAAPAPSTVPQPEMSVRFNSGGYSARHFPSTTVSAARANHELLATLPVPTRDQAKVMIRETAIRHGIDPSLALAIAHQESGFNHRNVSVANAIGLMQVIPSSGDWASQMIGRELNLLDPNDNVTAGVAILRSLLRSTDGNVEQALAGYYQGLASVRRNGYYSDTRAYIRTVTALQAQYR
ncbi:MAG: LysM peptidoglycan-binding domain-containing protein [Actinomycetia bacterium]|nr:LysM peptidoglycan-binding domain-containing protein [Actinomycetes bacterium]